MEEKLKAWASLLTAAAGLIYAWATAAHCKVEQAEMQQAVQVLADQLFR